MSGQLTDRGEDIGLIEPLLVSDGSPHRSELADLAITLGQKSASLRASLSPKIMEALATIVRSTNCYYSNLIEGHDTHPIDIETVAQGCTILIHDQNYCSKCVTIMRWKLSEGIIFGQLLSVLSTHGSLIGSQYH